MIIIIIIIVVVIMCRESGVYIGKAYGGGTGPIWLDDLQCTGNETSLINCTHRGWGVHNCSHDEDVSILCGYGGMLHPLPYSSRPSTNTITLITLVFLTASTTSSTTSPLRLKFTYS